MTLRDRWRGLLFGEQRIRDEALRNARERLRNHLEYWREREVLYGAPTTHTPAQIVAFRNALEVLEGKWPTK